MTARLWFGSPVLNFKFPFLPKLVFRQQAVTSWQPQAVTNSDSGWFQAVTAGWYRQLQHAKAVPKPQEAANIGAGAIAAKCTI